MNQHTVESRPEVVVDLSEKRPIRVLHVDDEVGLLKVSKQCLELQGPFQVDTAGSVEEAYNKLKEKEYDAVVSDYQMPGKDGLEFLEMLRKNGNTVPFVMFTGKGREEVAVRAWSLGADHYVNKTGDPETVYCELAHCLRSTVEKRFAEAQMKETVQKLQTIYQNAIEGISYVDAEENIVYANKAFADIIGYEQEQLAGMNLRKTLDDENWAKIENETKRRRQGESGRYEVDLRRSDGTVRNVLISGAPLLDHDGLFVGTIGIVLDITEQKKTKEAIKESEERFKSIFESVDDGLIYLDTTGRIVEINRKAVEFFGGSKEELLGKRFTKIGIFSIKDMPTLTKRFVDILRGKRTILDITIKNKKGQAIPLECSASLSKAYGKSTIAVVARDMTEHREKERLLREREEKYRSLVEQSMQGILIAQGPMPHMVFANSAMSKILGYSVEELLSLSPQQTTGLVHPDDRELFFGRFKDRLEGKPAPPQYEIRGITKDGTIVWLELSSARIEYGGQPAVQAIFTDITERKKTEEAVLAERDRLETVTRSIGAGLALISKDYRTLWANDVLKQIFGDVEGKICYSVYNQRSSICPGCGVREIFEAGKAKVVHEQVGKDVDGKTVWSEITATAVRDRDGNITAALELVVPITQRKKTEEDFLASEARWRSITENSPDHIMLLDRDGKILCINHTVPDLATEKVLGKSMYDYVPSECRKVVADCIENVSKTGKPGSYITEYHTKEGEIRQFDVRVGPVFQSGKVVGLVSNSTDITERKKAEEALRASEEKHRAISSVTADFLFSCVKVDEERFAIDWMTGATERIFGYSAKEIRDKGCWSFLVHPQDLSIFEKKVTGLRPGQSSVCELRINHKDGSTRWIKASSRVAKDSINPTHHRLFGACEDITDRKKAENSLRESEKKYHSLHSSMSEGVALHEITYDGLGKAVDYIILDVNPAFESIIGIKKEKAVGSKASELYKTGKPPYMEIYAEVAASGKPTSFETYFPPMRKHFNISVFSLARGKFATVFYDITERKKAELELQESEKKYRELADQLPVTVYEIDDKGRLTFVNDKGFEMTGYSREDLERGLNIIQMVASEGLEEAKTRIQRTLDGEKIGYNEYTVIRKDGSRFPAIVKGDAIVREGKIVGLRAVVLDITERKKAEESLKESEEKFRNLAESSPNMIFINGKGRIVYANTKAEQVMGYTKEEFYAPDFDFLSLIAPGSRSIVESSFSKHKNREEVDPYAYELVTKMGRKFQGLINTKLIKYDGEQAILGVVTDVSEMRNAEKSAKENQQKFAALFSGNPEATVYLDTGMHVLDVNPRFRCLFGYSPEEARGKHIDDLVVPENLLEEGRKLSKEATEGYVYYDTVRKTKEGLLIPVSVSAAPVYIQSELKGYVGLYKDISQQKGAETKLAMTNEKLRVVGGLTRHDVRNKLSTITGNAYVLRKQLADNKEVLDKIRDVETAVSQVARIFDFAKDYEMLGVEELAYIDVQKSVNEAVQLFSDLDGMRILNECHGLTVLSDSLLRQLFYNLMDNSLKYGKKLSQIRIHYEKAEGHQLRLIYEDDGVGISQDAKPKLFSESYTTGKGSGYGLYLIKRMMEVYSWAIEENGEPGKGARFVITIPKTNTNGKENYRIA